MKMKFWLFGAGAIALLSGCFGKPEIPADGATPENPAAKFDELTQKSRDAWADDLFADVPVFDFQKYRSDFALTGAVDAPNVGGKVNFELSVTGESDLSDLKNPKSSGKINLSTKVDGIFSGDGKIVAKFIVADKSLFASIEEIALNFPQIPASQIIAPLKPHFGKWYGDTLENIDAKTNGTTNFAGLFQNYKTPKMAISDLKKIIKTRKLFQMKSAKPVKNGFYIFEVELDEKEFLAAFDDILKLSNVPESDRKKAETQLENGLKTVSISGTLSISAENPKYFRFEGKSVNTKKTDKKPTDILLVVTKDERTLSLKNPEKDHFTITDKIKDDENVFEISGGDTPEKNETILRGKKSKTHFEFAFLEPKTEREVFSAALDKKDDNWTGTGKFADFPIVVEIQKLKFENFSHFETEISVKENDLEKAHFSITGKVTEDKSISISAPSEFGKFEELVPAFEAVLRAPTAGPPAGTPPEKLSDEEVQNLLNAQ